MKCLLEHDLLHDECVTITGQTIGQLLSDIPKRPRRDQDVIRQWEQTQG